MVCRPALSGPRGRATKVIVAASSRTPSPSWTSCGLSFAGTASPSYENVEMEAAAAQVSSDALGVQPVFVCPSDFGWVSRPRLWCLSVDWTRVATDPSDGSPLEWAKRGRWDRLHPLPAGWRPIPSSSATFSFTRQWSRGASSCLAPPRQPRRTTGDRSRARPGGALPATPTPGGRKGAASSLLGTTPSRPCSRTRGAYSTSRRRTSRSSFTTYPQVTRRRLEPTPRPVTVWSVTAGIGAWPPA